MADKVDPFDVKALESAVNDSATRVSAIWISFLVFALYLLVAATTVTQRQLLLADAIKLPVLNIDLPLWGFFFLAPILFVILHLYTLLQVLLLGRTTATYNAAVEALQLAAVQDSSLRQRLANTLFAQIFAGSPRERQGVIGWLLRAIVWITLAIAPVLVLLAFQFSFLPYHSHAATWTHRLLIIVELLAFFLIWPLALDARLNFQWPNIWADLKHLTEVPLRLIGPKERRQEAWSFLYERKTPLLACLLYLLIPLAFASFPGEPHLNLLTGQALTLVQCDRWLQRNFGFIDLQFDRLSLPRELIVDRTKFNRIEEAVEKFGESGESTHILSNRNFNCGVFSYSDLRRVDLSGSSLKGANLRRVGLAHADLSGTNLQGADLAYAHLEGALLIFAKLQGAKLFYADLGGTESAEAQFQGADLIGAQLQGADLRVANLQGAELRGAQLQGANLNEARLQGANLGEPPFGSVAANRKRARLQGADLSFAELQGTNFSGAELDNTVMSRVFTWRARNVACMNARIADLHTDEVVEFGEPDIGIPAFIERSIAEIPDAALKKAVSDRMRKALVTDPATDDTKAIAKVWKGCQEAETSRMSQEKFDQQRVETLTNVACNSMAKPTVLNGIIRNWVFQPSPSTISGQLARSLLGRDGKACLKLKNYQIGLLEEVAAMNTEK